MLMALLEVKGLRASYGPTRVLHGIDFAIDEGSITAVLGVDTTNKLAQVAQFHVRQPAGRLVE